jgi:hypothetical protein
MFSKFFKKVIIAAADYLECAHLICPIATTAYSYLFPLRITSRRLTVVIFMYLNPYLLPSSGLEISQSDDHFSDSGSGLTFKTLSIPVAVS